MNHGTPKTLAEAIIAGLLFAKDSSPIGRSVTVYQSVIEFLDNKFQSKSLKYTYAEEVLKELLQEITEGGSDGASDTDEVGNNRG